jgi:hypothetical protein
MFVTPTKAGVHLSAETTICGEEMNPELKASAAKQLQGNGMSHEAQCFLLQPI